MEGSFQYHDYIHTPNGWSHMEDTLTLVSSVCVLSFLSSCVLCLPSTLYDLSGLRRTWSYFERLFRLEFALILGLCLHYQQYVLPPELKEGDSWPRHWPSYKRERPLENVTNRMDTDGPHLKDHTSHRADSHVHTYTHSHSLTHTRMCLPTQGMHPLSQEQKRDESEVGNSCVLRTTAKRRKTNKTLRGQSKVLWDVWVEWVTIWTTASNSLLQCSRIKNKITDFC